MKELIVCISGQEIELTMHDGTVRDVCFLEDTSNKSSLLISGGAGDCKIYITDCATGQPYQALSGHSGNILRNISMGLPFNWKMPDARQMVMGQIFNHLHKHFTSLPHFDFQNIKLF